MFIPKKDERYTYADYVTWDDDERWELIDGVPYAMSPAPTQKHQEVGGEIYRQLANFLKGKPCKVFLAPFDVRLNADETDDTVCQPDILVVCDSTKLDGKCCKGAPDLVIEVLSPSTARKDRLIKYTRYQKAGVQEYWMVDVDTKTVDVAILENGIYVRTKFYSDEDILNVKVLDGCAVNLSEVFAE